MMDAGQIDEIRHYCETDVLNTYLVYLRYQLHTGTLSKPGYNAAVADVISFIDAEKEKRPYLNDFMEAWGEASGNKFILD